MQRHSEGFAGPNPPQDGSVLPGWTLGAAGAEGACLRSGGCFAITKCDHFVSVQELLSQLKIG